MESFSSVNRGRTLALLGVGAVCAAGAMYVGIDDNAVGIALAFLGAAAICLAFTMHVSAARDLWGLTVSLVIVLVALLVLGIGTGMAADLLRMPPTLSRVLELLSTTALLGAGLFCTPATVLTAVRTLLARRRESKARATAE